MTSDPQKQTQEIVYSSQYRRKALSYRRNLSAPCYRGPTLPLPTISAAVEQSTAVSHTPHAEDC